MDKKIYLDGVEVTLEQLEEARKNRDEQDEKESKRKLKNKAYNILADINKGELEKYREEKRKRILTPEEDYLTSLELSQICRKKDNFTTCMLVLNQLQRSLKNCESDIKARVGLAMGRFIHDDNDDPHHLDKAIA